MKQNIINGKHKGGRAIFMTLVVAVLVFIIGFVGFGDFNEYSPAHQTTTKIMTPDSEERPDEDTVVYTFTVNGDDKDCKTIEFYTNHQYVKVWADDELVYYIQKTNDTWGITTGSVYNFVDIPTGTGNVKIEIKAVYPNVRGEEYTFHVGNGYTILHEALTDSLVEVFISFVGFLVGIVLIVYWFIFHKNMDDITALYFGITAMTIGGWCLNETTYVTIMMQNRAAGSMASYVLLMLIPIPFVVFTKRYMQVEERYFGIAVCLLSMVNLFVCTLLHMTGIAGFKQTVYSTHVCLILAACYMIYGMVIHGRKFGFDHIMKIQTFASVAVVLSLLMDLNAYYLGMENTDVIGRFGLLIYIVLMAIESIRGFVQKIREGRKAELYKEMAGMDVMTGTKNRTAFELWEEDTRDFSDIMIGMFDLNDLKLTNDTLGHAVGDCYLQEAAKVIKSIFDTPTEVYRIGGDEFVAVIHNSGRVRIANLINRLNRAQKTYETNEAPFRMRIAYGFAQFEECDASIEDTVKRADQIMYDRKQKLKAGKEENQ